MLRAIAALSRFGGWLAASIILAIGLIVAYEAAMRYLFNSPTRWAEETARVLQIAMVYLAAAHLVAVRAHIRITALTAYVGPAVRRWLGRVAMTVTVTVAAIAAWQGWQLMAFSLSIGQRTDSTLELPMWVIQGPLVVGLVVVALQGAAMLVQSFREPALFEDDAAVRDG